MKKKERRKEKLKFDLTIFLFFQYCVKLEIKFGFFYFFLMSNSKKSILAINLLFKYKKTRRKILISGFKNTNAKVPDNN